MSQPIELPEGWDPRESLAADMSQAGEWDRLLKRHGLGRAGQFRPDSPWDSQGRLKGSYAPPPPPGTAPANGGIR